MQRILNHMKLQASLSNSDAKTRIGIVDSYDPDNYCCKVRIQPEDVPTGWIPIASIWVGNGWGLFVPPTVGDMVDVHFQEWDQDAGFVCLRFFNDSDRPVKCESGVFYLIHQTGSFLKFENDGKVSINTEVRLDMGTVGNTLHKLVTDAMVALFNGHTHQVHNVQAGGSTVVSDVPVQAMGEAQLTQIVRGN